MSGISHQKFYATVQRPSVEALELLAPYLNQISSSWRNEVAALDPKYEVILTESAIDCTQFAAALRKSTYRAFRQRVQEFGQTLARRGVALDCAVGALNRLGENCLAVLTQNVSRSATLVLALTRLHALVAVLMVSGYTGQWAAGKKTGAEASLLETEQRRHVSAYVTRIYEQERRRLSHDLHDDVGHDLLLIKLYLEMMLLDSKRARRVPPRLPEAIAIVSHAIEAIRRLVFDLGPAVFENLGFLPAVRSYINQFSARTKVKVTLREGHLPAEIPSRHQIALYRVLQGALSNVLKHAASRNVLVSLESANDAVVMVIEDDGVGFDPCAKLASRSVGLTAMRERVEVLGGKVHVQSRVAVAGSRAHGTRIEVDLPLSFRQTQ